MAELSQAQKLSQCSRSLFVRAAAARKVAGWLRLASVFYFGILVGSIVYLAMLVHDEFRSGVDDAAADASKLLETIEMIESHLLFFRDVATANYVDHLSQDGNNARSNLVLNNMRVTTISEDAVFEFGDVYGEVEHGISAVRDALDNRVPEIIDRLSTVSANLVEETNSTRVNNAIQRAREDVNNLASTLIQAQLVVSSYADLDPITSRIISDDVAILRDNIREIKEEGGAIQSYSDDHFIGRLIIVTLTISGVAISVIVLNHLLNSVRFYYRLAIQCEYQAIALRAAEDDGTLAVALLDRLSATGLDPASGPGTSTNSVLGRLVEVTIPKRRDDRP